MTFRPELLDELLQGYDNPQDLLGEGGILKQLTKALVERGTASRHGYPPRRATHPGSTRTAACAKSPQWS
nr:hypothetical protein [Chroococcidiopsis cubana]